RIDRHSRSKPISGRARRVVRRPPLSWRCPARLGSRLCAATHIRTPRPCCKTGTQRSQSNPRSNRLIDAGKHNVVGVQVHAVDYESAVEKIIGAAKRSEPMSIAAVSVHGVMMSVLDSTHRYRLNKHDLVVPDGQPVRWALNCIHKAKLEER